MTKHTRPRVNHNTNSMMCSVALVSARKPRSMSTRILLYRLILPTAVAAYSNVYLQGYLNRQHQYYFTRPSYQDVVAVYPNKESAHYRYPSHRTINTSLKSAESKYEVEAKSLSTADIQHMKLAARLAGIGKGNTYPNPAVGCVLVKHNDEDEIIGSGFHPRAGMPHAEIFALLEACGHVDDGVNSARSVMDDTTTSEEHQQVLDLLQTYKSEDGANKLFKDCLVDSDITAYVTLEPCCHVGQTPPCTLSLVAAGVNRVVVGFRDPNPRVDGGGIKVLQDSGVDVLLVGSDEADSGDDQIAAANECENLVKHFVKRISPRKEPVGNLDEEINGKKRRALRKLAGRQKTNGTIKEVEWPRDFSISAEDKKDSSFGERVSLDVKFLEKVDNLLWDHEIVLLRLNNVVHKKKGAKLLSERVANELNAHVAQVIGHTSLLYRPAFVPVLDLDELTSIDDDGGE